MIEKWIGKTGIVLLAAALMLCAAGLLFLTARQFIGLIEQARIEVRNERDAHWRAELAASEAKVQAEIAEALRETMARQDAAIAKVSEAEARAAELERENAALPDNGVCGVGRDRVRLLNKR